MGRLDKGVNLARSPLVSFFFYICFFCFPPVKKRKIPRPLVTLLFSPFPFFLFFVVRFSRRVTFSHYLGLVSKIAAGSAAGRGYLTGVVVTRGGKSGPLGWWLDRGRRERGYGLRMPIGGSHFLPKRPGPPQRRALE